MIDELDLALKSFVTDTVPGAKHLGAIAFDLPDKEWISDPDVRQPALNLFLWDIRRSATEARSGRISGDYRGEQRYQQPPVRIALSYFISAWSQNLEDEHRVIGNTLAALLPYRSIPLSYFGSSPLATVKPAPDLRVASSVSKEFIDFWSTIDGRLKAGIHLVVTISVSPEMGVASTGEGS